MKALKEDARLALEGLPWEYGDAAEMQRLSAKYAGADQGKVIRVFGANFIVPYVRKGGGSVCGKSGFARASPAYSDQSGVDWKTAAASAAKVLNHIGGVDGMDPTGWTWYCNVDDIENLAQPNHLLKFCGVVNVPNPSRSKKITSRPHSTVTDVSTQLKI